MAMRLLLLLVLSLLLCGVARCQEPNGQVHGFVSFSTTRVEVQEDSGNPVTTIQLPLVREVGSTGTILATVEVSTCVNNTCYTNSQVLW